MYKLVLQIPKSVSKTWLVPCIFKTHFSIEYSIIHSCSFYPPPPPSIPHHIPVQWIYSQKICFRSCFVIDIPCIFHEKNCYFQSIVVILGYHSVVLLKLSMKFITAVSLMFDSIREYFNCTIILVGTPCYYTLSLITRFWRKTSGCRVLDW